MADKTQIRIIDAKYLTDSELEYEYTVRELNIGSVSPSLKARNITELSSIEYSRGDDTSETLRMSNEKFEQAEFDQFVASAKAIIWDIQREFATDANMDPEAALTRLAHYYLRLCRYPVDKTETERLLFGQFEVVMAVVGRALPTQQMPRPVVTDTTNTHATYASASVELNGTSLHNSTINTDMTNVPPPANAELDRNANSSADASNQSLHITNRTEYVPSREEMSVYAGAPTPQTRWSPPSDELRSAYMQRQMASTQIPAGRLLNNETQYEQASHLLAGNHRTGSETRSVANRGTQVLTRSPGADLRSLKQFLSNRYFDGETFDKTHMGVEDFILSLSMYARTSLDAADTIMRNMASLLTGKALVWWSNQVTSIATFSDFIQSLRCRFATYTSDRHGMISAIYRRMQRKDETLADYVDSMRAMMANVPDIFDDITQVRTITRNADPEWRKLLLGKVYGTMQDFTRFVNELAHISVPTPSSSRNDKKPSFGNKKVHAMEFANETEHDSEDESEDESDRTMDILATILRKAMNGSLHGRQRIDPKKRTRDDTHRRSPSFNSNENKGKGSGPSNQAVQGQYRPPVSCYGCGTPNVYRPECQVCNAKRTTESNSKNELPLLESSTIQE